MDRLSEREHEAPISFRHAAIVQDNIFSGNSADQGGGITFCIYRVPPHPLILHNLVVNNTAHVAGGGIGVSDANPDLQWMTIDGNQAPPAGGGGVYVSDNSTHGPMTITNSIVANSQDGGGIAGGPDGLILTGYCNVWGNTGGDYIGISPDPTDISADPEYCPDLDKAYWIYETSPCVGSGSGGYDIGRYGVGCFRTPNVIFYDNFSDQNADGWSEEVQGDGSWDVVAGRYDGDSGSLSAGLARTVVEDLTAEGFTLQLEVRPVSSMGTNSVLFRADDEAGSFYRMSLDNAIGMLERVTSHGTVLLHEFPCPMAVGDDYIFLVSALGGSLEAWYGPAGVTPADPLFAVHDAAPLMRGSVGMECADGGAASFDNVLVAALDSSSAPDPARDFADVLRGSDGLRVHPAPSPFREAAGIAFTLPRRGPVLVEVYGVSGERVRSLAAAILDEGPHMVEWDGRNDAGASAGSGVYFVRVATPRATESCKVVLTR